MGTCDECGATRQRGLDCREQWDELIALEFSDVRDRPVTEVRDEMAHAVEGSERVRADAGTAPPSSVAWSCTVADLGPPDVGLHTARIRQWAGSVVEDLAS